MYINLVGGVSFSLLNGDNAQTCPRQSRTHSMSYFFLEEWWELKIEMKPVSHWVSRVSSRSRTHCFPLAPVSSSWQFVTAPGNRYAVLSPRRSGKRQLRILGSQALVPFEQGQESLCRSQAGFLRKVHFWLLRMCRSFGRCKASRPLCRVWSTSLCSV